MHPTMSQCFAASWFSAFLLLMRKAVGNKLLSLVFALRLESMLGC